MPVKPRSGATPPTVAEFLTNMLEMSESTQKEIAAALGYEKSNIITMFKQGHTKVPLGKVKALAHALNVDPAYLIRLVIREYHPDMWSAIEECLGGGLATDNEREILEEIRGVTGNSNPKMDPQRRTELRRWAKTLGI